MFILKSSWFSKFDAFSLALLGLKTNPAILKSLSQAADAGRGVFNLTDNLHTAGKDLSKSMLSAEQAKYASNCLVPCVFEPCKLEKKSSSS